MSTGSEQGLNKTTVESSVLSKLVYKRTIVIKGSPIQAMDRHCGSNPFVSAIYWTSGTMDLAQEVKRQ